MRLLLFLWIFSSSVLNALGQESAWRYVVAGVNGYEGQLVFETPTIASHPQFKNVEPGLHLRIYDEPERYFDQPTAGGKYIKAALLNNTLDTVVLYQVSNLEGITTEVKKGDEWVNFQKLLRLEGHLSYISVPPNHYVDIGVQFTVSGKVKVPYRIRLVTTKAVVLSNEITIGCSKAQFEQAGIPFAH